MGKSDNNYLVLARKYRPQTFAELIGQSALVQTLSNAIKSGRLHHAYLLTGIRGTGKTTTARIISKALNCENGPAITWDEKDPQVQAITQGNHTDVLEFDAASNRGVEEISDLFEGVNYAPAQGRRKIYIVDEVHMLSKHAFNSLLKTLEEPPSHVTFIFATTEVHKIPITILSRCQRFDLKRVPVAELAKHYQNILKQEEITAEDSAIQQIAKAADGSVRDGLSLLDQAISLAGKNPITVDLINDMLGLSDRTKVADILEAMLNGNAQKTLQIFDDLHALGQDPVLLLTDCMGMVDTLTRLKIIPDLSTSKNLTELEKTRLVPLAEKLALENLSRLYQMLLTAVTEAKQASRPAEAVSMAVVRICYLASLPPVSSLIKTDTEDENQPPAPQKTTENKIVEKPTEEPAPWEAEATEKPIESIKEIAERKEKEFVEIKENDADVKQVLDMFPGAEIVEVK